MIPPDDFDKHVNNVPEEESRRREALSEIFCYSC